MSDGLKYERANIELRRGKVLELFTKGHSQTEIAKTLNCSPALITLDLQYIRERSKKELETHISDRLPFEFVRAMEGMQMVLKSVSEIEDEATDTKTKLECSKLKMDLYRSIMTLATDGSVIQRAINMIKIIAPLPGEDIRAKSQEDATDSTDFTGSEDAGEDQTETEE